MSVSELLTELRFRLRALLSRGAMERELDAELQFHLEDVLWGMNSIVLYYKNQKSTRTAEFMELSPSGKVVRVVANYNG